VPALQEGRFSEKTTPVSTLGVGVATAMMPKRGERGTVRGGKKGIAGSRGVQLFRGGGEKWKKKNQGGTLAGGEEKKVIEEH